MGRNSSTSICILVIIIASDLTFAKEGPYEFAKLTLLWVPSQCNQDGYDCVMPILDRDRFVIRKFEPMYWDDIIVPPYYQDHGCNPNLPEKYRYAGDEVLTPMIPELSKHWPYLLTTEDEFTQDEGNLLLWWPSYKYYGLCYIQNHPPLYYYESAMHLMNLYGIDMVQILRPEGTSGFDRYLPHQASHFSTTLKHFLGHRPQIRCNSDSYDFLQLFEIGICVDREVQLIDCKVEYVDCDEHDLIKFPPAV